VSPTCPPTETPPTPYHQHKLSGGCPQPLREPSRYFSECSSSTGTILTKSNGWHVIEAHQYCEREIKHQRLSTTMKIPIIPLFFPLLANAYTWKFTTEPRQCQNVSIAVDGSGNPPYSLLIIPSGPSPLPNTVEVRSIQSMPFLGNSSTLSFKLNYPENSSFVAVVSRYSS
jgi:hypothetical protein